MAYGQIVGYEPGPSPGAYNFKRADGSSMMFVGPAAEDLKGKLDAADKLQPQPTAGLGAELVGMSAAPKVATDAPAPVPGAAPAAPGKYAGAFLNAPSVNAPQGQQAPSAAAPGAPAQSEGGGPLSGFKSHGLGVYEGPDGRLYEYQAPRAGSKGGMVERSRSISGGFDENQGYVERKEENYLGAQAANEAQMEAARGQAQAEAAYLQEQDALLKQREEEAWWQKQQIDSGVAALEAKREAAAKEYAGSKVDPGRALAGGKNWIAGIASALGAYGATLGGTPNFAAQIIEGRIRDDIEAQKAEIAVKRDAADNALADLTRKLGSQKLAEEALRDIQGQNARNAFALKASGTKDQELAAKHLAIANEIEARQLDWREQYRQAALGTVTKNIVNAPGSAGSKGGLVPVNNQLGTAQGLLNVEKGRADLATDKSKAPGGVVGTRKAATLADIDAALSAIDRIDLTHAKADRPGVFTTGYFGSDVSQDLGAQVDALAPGLGRALEGNAPNESTMNAIREGLLSRDGDKVKKSLQAYRQQLIDRRSAVESGAVPMDEPTTEKPRE